MPATAQCLAQTDACLQSRELILAELVARRVQAALRLEYRLKLAGAFVITGLGPSQGLPAVFDVVRLRLLLQVQILDRRESDLDIPIRIEDRRAIAGQQLLLMGLGLVVSEVDDEATAVEVFEYDVPLGIGSAYAPPRTVRLDVLEEGAAEAGASSRAEPAPPADAAPKPPAEPMRSPPPSTPSEIASTFAAIGSEIQKAVSQTKSTANTLKGLKPSTRGMSDGAVMQALGEADVPAEGQFFPDTYAYAKNASDISIYKQALTTLDKRLQAAWDAGDIGKLRNMATDALFMELAQQIANRKGAPNHTEVLNLHCELLNVGDENGETVATLRFSGTAREDGAPTAGFEDIWTLTKPSQAASGWLLAGVESN